MAKNNEANKLLDKGKIIAVITAILGATLGGGGSSYYVMSGGFGPTEVEAFGGITAAAAHERMNSFNVRLVRIETQYEAIIANQTRILRVLESR